MKILKFTVVIWVTGDLFFVWHTSTCANIFTGSLSIWVKDWRPCTLFLCCHLTRNSLILPTLHWLDLYSFFCTFLHFCLITPVCLIQESDKRQTNHKMLKFGTGGGIFFVFVLPSTYLWPQKRQKQALADSSFYLTCPFQVALHSPLSKVLTSFWLPVALLTRSTQITHNALWCTNTWGQ